jgi:hypothetical protein
VNLKNLFARSAASQDGDQAKIRETDSFANSVLFEIKAVVGSAIAQALQEKEGRYMRSILQESHFRLQALAVKALDSETARTMEDFISAHEAFDPGFRRQFFRQVLQPQYRSSGGATVNVAADLIPVIELDRQNLEPQTEDESFLISLKGRRVRFEAHAVLDGPIKNTPPERHGDSPSGFGSTAFGRLTGGAKSPAPPAAAPNSLPPASATSRPAAAGPMQVRIAVHDRSGQRSQQFALPVVLGRDLNHPSGGAPIQGMDVNATYVSRRQLLIFELLGQVYCFVPRSASLTFSTQAQLVLRPDCLETLEPGSKLMLIGGVPMDTLLPPPDRQSASDYPRVELELLDGHKSADATPRPRAV